MVCRAIALTYLIPNCPFIYLLCFSRTGLGTLASAQICLLPVFVSEALLKQPHSLVYILSVGTFELLQQSSVVVTEGHMAHRAQNSYSLAFYRKTSPDFNTLCQK